MLAELVIQFVTLGLPRGRRGFLKSYSHRNYESGIPGEIFRIFSVTFFIERLLIQAI